MAKNDGKEVRMRRRRLALFLAFALALGIAPKVDAAASNVTGDSGIALRTVEAEGDVEEEDSYVVAQNAYELIGMIDDFRVNHIDTTSFRTRFEDTRTFVQAHQKEVTNDKINECYLDPTTKTIFPRVPTDEEKKNLISLGTVDKGNNLIAVAQSFQLESVQQKINVYLDMNTLLYEKAVDAIVAISTANSAAINELNYSDFVSKMDTAHRYLYGDGSETDKKVTGYYTFYDEKAKDSMFQGMLLNLSSYTVENNNKLRNYALTGYNTGGVNYLTMYETKKRYYDIEVAYHQIMNVYSNVMDDSIIALIAKKGSGTKDDPKGLYQSVYETDGGGEADLNALASYNGGAIRQFLKNYVNIKRFKEYLSLFVGVTELDSLDMVRKAVDMSNYYENNLTAEEKKLISFDDKQLYDKVMSMNGGASAVISKINTAETLMDKIRSGDQTSYNSFSSAYADAKLQYDLFLKAYASVPNAESLIENHAKLDGDMKVVKEFTDRVAEALLIKPALACDYYLTTFSKIYEDYKKLTTSNASRIYNYSSFSTMYNDVKAAYDLRVRVDKLGMGVTADRDKEVDAVRKAYSALNAQAKKYFGETGSVYLSKIEQYEYEIYVNNINMAASVDDLILAIGTVTKNSGTKIITAENAYNVLTDTQKALVKYYSTLLTARRQYNELRSDLSTATVINIKKGYVYTHAAIAPVPTVKVDGVVLTRGIDYTIAYSNNKNVGTGRVVITAIDGSGYKGTFAKSFQIVKDSLDGATISGMKKKYKYTGKKIKPNPDVVCNGYGLKKGTDYTITYTNNKKVGTATLTIKGKGNYKGSKSRTFKIYKAKKK